MARIEELSYLGYNDTSKTILAHELGISVDELEMLDYDILPHREDDALYGYELKFKNDNSDIILSKIQSKYRENPIFLAPWQLDKNFDFERQLSAIREKKNTYNKFLEEIDNVARLNQIILEDSSLSNILKRQIFISIIGILETFLSETFIRLTDKEQDYFKNFVESHPEFKKRKFELKDIFLEKEKLKDTATKIMMDTIYHNLPQVKEMFTSTFNIEFPDIEDIYKFILERHDLVHRNGKTKEGTHVTVDDKKIDELIKVTTDFVREIALKLNIK
jgi:hypothetical protein